MRWMTIVIDQRVLELSTANKWRCFKKLWNMLKRVVKTKGTDFEQEVEELKAWLLVQEEVER